MSIMELEHESKLHEIDIQHISSLVANAIDLKGTTDRADIIDSKANILDSLAKMLELILRLDNLTRETKLEVVHLLSKLNANKEYMKLVKENITDQQQTLSKLHTASAHMFKKSQSAIL